MANKDLVTQVHELILDKKIDDLKELLNQSDKLTILELLKDLSSKELVITYRLLQKDTALFMFENLDTSFQLQLIESLNEEQSNALIAELETDDRVRLFDELPAGVVKRMLSSLSKDERQMTTLLLGYENKTAGRIMNPEYIRINRKMTVKEALDKVRKSAEEVESIYNLFITNSNRKLEGVITLRKLLLSSEDAIVETIMSSEPKSVTVDEDQEEAANIMQELDLLALPVVDKQGLLVGVITIDDAMDILEEEATEDILDKAGLAKIKHLENTRSEVLVKGSLWDIWKVRLPFLFIGLIGGLIAAVVMEGFEDALYEVAALAFFVPLIMAMGGSVGTQSSTVFSRGYLLGHVRLNHFWRHLLKELSVGLSIGILCGILAGTAAFLIWGEPGNAINLGLAVGISLAAVSAFAAGIGFLVPYVLYRLNMDQGAGKDPIITTLKDIIALLIYFSVATLIMNI